MSRKENDDFVATEAEKTFNDDGETIEVEFCKKLRNEMKFASVNDLINQLNNDEKACRAFFD